MEHTCSSCSLPCDKFCKNCAKVTYCSQTCQKKDWPTHRQQCYPAEIIFESSGTPVLVATKTIPAGSIVLTDWPIVYGPHVHKSGGHVCLGCCKVMRNKTKCPDCGWPFCSDNCEMKNLHQSNECLLLSSNLINFTDVPVEYDMIRLIRLLLISHRDPVKFQEFMCLPFDSAKKLDKYETHNRSQVIKVMRCVQLFEDMDEQMIGRAFDILEFNGRMLLQRGNKSESIVYTFNGKIGHNCIPNTQTDDAFDTKAPKRVAFPFHGMNLISTKPIKKGEKLTQSITYGNIMEGTMARRATLLKGGINCRCSRCLDPTELGTNLSAIKCPTVDCEGYILPLEPIDFETSWECSICHGNVSSKKVDKILNPITQAANLINDETETRGFNTFSIAMREFTREDFLVMAKMEKFLDSYDKLLHPNHYLIFKVKKLLLMAHHVYFLGRQRELTPSVEVREKRLRLLERYEDLTKYCMEIANVILAGKSQFMMKVLYFFAASQWLKFMELIYTGGSLKHVKDAIQHAIEATKEVEDIAKFSPPVSANKVFASLLQGQMTVVQELILQSELAEEMGHLFL